MIRTIMSAILLFPALTLSEVCDLTGIEMGENEKPYINEVCEAHKNAKGFFKKLGYETQIKIKLKIVQDLHIEYEGVKYYVFGLYKAKENLVQFTAPTSKAFCDTSQKYFKIQITPDESQCKWSHVKESLFKSLMTHELAHAIIDQNFKNKISHGPHEFLAYAAQIDSLDPDVKKIVLDNYSTSEFDDPYQINAMVHAMRPHWFGALSYKYFKNHPQVRELVLSLEDKSLDPDARLNDM